MYNGPPPDKFVPWISGIELPVTYKRYRVVCVDNSYVIQVKGWFFWYSAKTRFSTPEEVIDIIKVTDEQFKPIKYKIVCETKWTR